MKVISISNQKGGVSKSTTTQALLTGLLNKGYKTLAIDLDPQLTLSILTGANTNTEKTIRDTLLNKTPITEAIQHTAQGDIVPASRYLFSLEKDNSIGREYGLKEAIEPLSNMYDFILIDTAPNLGELSIKALTCSDYVIIPVLADMTCIVALQQIQETITGVQKYTNKDLKVLGILLTRYNNRTLLNKEILEPIKQQAAELNTRVFDTTIRETILVKQAQANLESIYTYCPKATATQDYLAFIDEMLRGIK